MNSNEITPPFKGENRRDDRLGDADLGYHRRGHATIGGSLASHPQPDIDPWIAPVGNPLRLRVLVELIKADQECRWKWGIRPRLKIISTIGPSYSVGEGRSGVTRQANA